MKKNNINFTKQVLLSIKPILGSRLIYHDTNEKGLSLYVTSNGVKTFFVRRRINGVDEKIVLGHFPDLSIEQARKLALKNKGKIAIGINPNNNKKKLKQEMDLKELFNEFMCRYARHHKKTYKYDENQFNRYLSLWKNKKLSTIQKHDIQKLHAKIKEEHGLYSANRLLSLLKTLFNKAIEWGWDGTNPTIGTKKFREKSRDRFLQAEELPKFFKALNKETSKTIKDFIYILFFTGARKTNVLAMRWDEIDFKKKVWKIPETKNGEPLMVPLVDEAIVVLKERKKEILSEWVFPSTTSKSGHLVEIKRVWHNLLDKAGIENFRIHDLRRTLGSYQAITGASLQIIGKSLGHKSQQATQVYSKLNDDPVRASMIKAIKVIMDCKNDN
jgi:integrase